MIYVPNDSYSCYVIQDSNTIRAYHSVPHANSSVVYTDYYVNSHYMERVGTQNFGNYNFSINCLDSSKITSNYYYRNDFDSILIIFFIMCIVVFVIPFKLFSRIFGRWLKL